VRVLMVLTSHDTLGDTGEKTGFWLEEFASPYYVFKDAGADIVLASPRGGQPPLDPKSQLPDFQTESTHRFEADENARGQLATTLKLSEVDAADFDALFYPGGHGPLWDLYSNPDSLSLIEKMYKDNKPVASVCHGPAVLINAKVPSGRPIVEGKNITAFSNTEEASVGLTEVVPFSLEDSLREKGSNFSCAGDWEEHVCVDGHLITGQNPASSAKTALLTLESIQRSA